MSYARSAGPWERESVELVEFLAAHPRTCSWNGPFLLGEVCRCGTRPVCNGWRYNQEEEAFAHISDIVPTQWHLAHNLASAFDAYPGDLCRSKPELLERASREEV